VNILVCGGRHFADVPFLWKWLDDFASKQVEPGVRLVIEGASDDVTGPYVGADYWAHQWALARTIPYVRIHAQWKLFGKAAGPLRNNRMLRECEPDCVIAFEGGNGTDDMVRKAKEAGLPVHEVKTPHRSRKKKTYESDGRRGL
jgi:hypothetical protein